MSKTATEFSASTYLELVWAGKITEAIEYRASYVPNYLYKFFWLSNDEKDDLENEKRFATLGNNCIWFAPAVAQNDPYECRGIYLDSDKLIEVGVLQKSIELATDLFVKETLIAAFTENMSDNLPMWAHYANNHRGFCVKYLVKDKMRARNVIYEPKRVPIATLFCNFLDAARKSEINSDFIKIAEKYATILQDIFFFKHSSWSYEKEYRFLYQKRNNVESTGLSVKLNDLALEPVEIYCGINCSKKNKQRLHSIAKSIDVSCKDCKMSETDFTVLT